MKMPKENYTGEGVADGVTVIDPKRRSLVGVAASLRRISKSIDEFDVMLLLAAVRTIKDTSSNLNRAVNLANRLANRMLCEEIAKTYGMTYEFPNRFYKTVTRTIGGHKKRVHLCVLVPPLKTVVVPKMYRNTMLEERNNERANA